MLIEIASGRSVGIEHGDNSDSEDGGGRDDQHQPKKVVGAKQGKVSRPKCHVEHKGSVDLTSKHLVHQQLMGYLGNS